MDCKQILLHFLLQIINNLLPYFAEAVSKGMDKTTKSRVAAVSDVVREHRGYLVRMLNCLSEFHAKHQQWPDALRLPREANDALLNTHLTPLGYAMLTEKLHLKVAQDDQHILLAERSDGKTLDYGEEGWSGKTLPKADVWIWGN